jgi:hypothetical protein
MSFVTIAATWIAIVKICSSSAEVPVYVAFATFTGISAICVWRLTVNINDSTVIRLMLLIIVAIAALAIAIYSLKMNFGFRSILDASSSGTLIKYSIWPYNKMVDKC